MTHIKNKKLFIVIGVVLILLLLAGTAMFVVPKIISEFSEPEYTYVETVTKRATCTESGTVTFVCSEDESKTYTEEIPALGHEKSPYYTADEKGHWHACLRCGMQMDYDEHTVTDDPEVAVSCESDGKTAGSHCTVCEHVLKAQKITALKYGHKFASYVKTADGRTASATCTNCGYKDVRTVAKIIVLAGQSNAVGQSFSYHLDNASFQKYKAGFENVQIYYSCNPYSTSETKNIGKTFVNVALKQGKGTSAKYAGGCFGPEIGIAEYLSETYPGEKFFIIKDATGGTTLYDRWYSPSSCEYLGKSIEEKNLYTHLVDWVDDGAQILYDEGYYPEIVSLAWMQGENDSKEHFADYSYLFTNFVNDLTRTWSRKDYLPKTGLSVVQGGITDYWTFYDALNLEKSIYAQLNSKAYYIDVAGSPWVSYRNDNTDYAHHDAASMVQLGRAFGEKFSLALKDYASPAVKNGSVWDGADFSVKLSGTGAKQDPYLIESMADMAYFALSVKRGNTYEGQYIKLTADLNMANPAFTGIGSKTAVFAGNFDGGGHTVQVHMRGKDYMGLFANNAGTIKNITVEGSVNSDWTKSALYVGGIAGYSSGSIENCVNKADIYAGKSVSAYWMGGIAGYLSKGTIADCTNFGTVGTMETTVHTSGGIVGYVRMGSSVTGCKNSGTVYGSYELGGIAGLITSDNIIRECGNSGEIMGKGSSSTGGVAGIVGTMYVSRVSGCSNSGTVSNGSSVTGGIVGLIKESSSSEGRAVISDCVNESDLISSASYVGGVVGYANVKKISVEISNCSNRGDITGRAYAGGIVGSLGSEKGVAHYLSECNNSGNILSTGHITVSNVDSSRTGGIAGMSYGKLTLCESTGTVRAEEYGISADAQAGTGANRRVGLLVGYKTSTCSIEKAYTWSEEILKPATCLEEGIKKLVCVENSSKSYTESIEKSAHSADSYTRSADGKTVSGICSACGEHFEKEVARVIILAGQSNAVGQSFAYHLDGETFKKYANGFDNIKIYYSNNPYSTSGTKNVSSDFVSVTLGQGKATDESYAGGCMGPEAGIAEYLSETYPGEKFFIIKDATGGTTLHDRWYSPSSCEYLSREMQDNSLYTHLISWVDSGIELLKEDGYYPEIFTLAWMQGENDSLNYYGDYTYLFRNFINDLTEDWYEKNYLAENGLAVIQGGITDYWTNFEATNRIKELYAETHSKGYFIDVANSDWVSYSADNTDYAHHDAASMARLGQEFGKMIAAAWEDRNNPAAYESGTVWDGLTVSKKLSGAGSEADPYRIESTADMAYFAKSVCGGNTYDGYYIRLMTDLDMSHPNFKGIGDSGNAFAGEFDGNGHTVKVYIRGKSYLGLFTRNSGVIENVTVSGSVSTNYTSATALYIGGIAGYNTGTIRDCTNKADIYVLRAEKGYWLGGIAGSSTGAVIENCRNEGTVGREGITVHTVGGITGLAEKGTTVTGCVNAGSVSGRGSSTTGGVGGIVGTIYVATVEKCENSGKISNAYTVTGGIVGLVKEDAETSSGNAVVKECKNLVPVQTDYVYVGGIVGFANVKNMKVQISNCENGSETAYADITGKAYVAGIIGNLGYVKGASHSIIGCKNFGNITAKESVTVSNVESTRVGGIAGMSYGSIKGCSSSGTVKADKFNVTASAEAGAAANYRTGKIVGYKTSACTLKENTY